MSNHKPLRKDRDVPVLVPERVPPDVTEPGDDLLEDELVHEDDTVIGTAFRRSLMVIGILAVLALVVVLLVRRPEEAVPQQALGVQAAIDVVQAVNPPEVRFVDITREAGIDFVHVNGGTGEKLLPETMGGGVAFLDYDADGDMDLLFVNSSHWPHDRVSGPPATMALYANDGGGRFQNVTRAAGLDVSVYGMGVAVADYDADGRVDVFITAVGENRLFRNLGGRFAEVTATAGVAGADDAWSTGAAFFDYDSDGDLDLFVCNYVEWSKEIDFKQDFRLTGIGRAFGPPQHYGGTYSYLYRNDGDGRFTDVSAASGIQVNNVATGEPMGKSLALGPVDIDRDGYMDLFVANDTVQNFFFRNNGDGTFKQQAEQYGLAYDRDGNATGAMGVDSAHYRNDSDLGFVIGNFANEMTSVYVSQGDPYFFVDEAIGEGIGAPSRRALTFGVLLFDYDLDGRLDLLAANGHIEDQIEQVDPSQQYRQASQLFWNAGPDQPRGFVPVPPEMTGDLATKLVGRGAAFADIDGDGDLDVVVTQISGPPLLVRNEQATGHHWLRVKLEGDGGNRDAIGAWVTVKVGDTVQRRQVMPTRSYLAQVELPLTFGLGAAEAYDALEVAWPDGSVQSLPGGTVDRLLTVRQAAGG